MYRHANAIKERTSPCSNWHWFYRASMRFICTNLIISGFGSINSFYRKEKWVYTTPFPSHLHCNNKLLSNLQIQWNRSFSQIVVFMKLMLLSSIFS
ncbi:hypothetical protein SPOG_05781 [Schizosaccharomyces cryophilus OY26]|uniref:Uncharacterized protein n=1 Tax=Schizosaccharomyces cryophilus (strain OY26 / ATCC MYA-4695 / CBS 11777 / NBRC 106824 / NRRL Y48691) TaxID=653667 RepID=S9VMH6_SCHCR|nr:uncharacterized protein SPOG_05781 [Schizosaccharomyces cryophilus OY26]EPY49158.1 hypothetical protein SPOG_05781 [Schizosaccharomyces cryophilus OY26]